MQKLKQVFKNVKHLGNDIKKISGVTETKKLWKENENMLSKKYHTVNSTFWQISVERVKKHDCIYLKNCQSF